MEIWMIVVAVLVIVIGIVAYRIYTKAKVASGTPWQRFMAVFKYSGTILWSRIVTFFGVLAGLAANAADWFGGSPQIQAAVHDVFDPKYVPWYLVGVALVTEYLRRRPVPANTPPVNVPLPPIANPPSSPAAPTVVTPAVVTPPTQ